RRHTRLVSDWSSDVCSSDLKSLLRWRDFYSMSDCRDFLFHVQEHQFELPQIAAMLRDRGLTVLGMSKQLPRHAVAAYRQMFPSRSEERREGKSGGVGGSGEI